MTKQTQWPLRPFAVAIGLAGAALLSMTASAAAADDDYRYGRDRGYNNGYNTQYIKCQSKDYERTIRCRSYGNVKSVRIYNKLSKAPCRYKRDWGYAHDGVWVRNGCRAVFSVSYSGGGRYGNNDRYRDRDRYGYNDGYYGGRDRYGSSGRYSSSVEQCIRVTKTRLRRDGFRNPQVERVDGYDRRSTRVTFRVRHGDHYHYPEVSCTNDNYGPYLSRYDWGAAGRKCGFTFRLGY